MLVFGAWAAIVGVGVDADAATRQEESFHLDIFGVHELDEVFHDDVDTILVEVAMVAETEQVEFQAFAFHHAQSGDIVDKYLPEVGLACNGAESGELRTVEPHPIVVVGVLVLESFQQLGVVVGVVTSGIAQCRQVFFFAVTHVFYFGVQN